MRGFIGKPQHNVVERLVGNQGPSCAFLQCIMHRVFLGYGCLSMDSIGGFGGITCLWKPNDYDIHVSIGTRFVLVCTIRLAQIGE